MNTGLFLKGQRIKKQLCRRVPFVGFFRLFLRFSKNTSSNINIVKNIQGSVTITNYAQKGKGEV